MRSNKKSLYPEISRQFEDRAELADVIEKSIRTVTRIMAGERAFTKRDRVKICDYLGMTEAEIFRKEQTA
jgi:transcriptional regulator with XRE-family HTH domain